MANRDYYSGRVGTVRGDPMLAHVECTFSSGVPTVIATASDPGITVSQSATGDYDIAGLPRGKLMHPVSLTIEPDTDTPAASGVGSVQPRSLNAAAGTAKVLTFARDDVDLLDPPDAARLTATFLVSNSEAPAIGAGVQSSGLFAASTASGTTATVTGIVQEPDVGGVLLVTIAKHSTTVVVPTVTYDGATLTRDVDGTIDDSGNILQLGLYYVPTDQLPAAGTGKSAVATWSSTQQPGQLVVIPLVGVRGAQVVATVGDAGAPDGVTTNTDDLAVPGGSPCVVFFASSFVTSTAPSNVAGDADATELFHAPGSPLVNLYIQMTDGVGEGTKSQTVVCTGGGPVRNAWAGLVLQKAA